MGSHLPGWIKSLLPKSALTVEEEAWNAYPYTKTRYTCPFVEKFSLEIETYYFSDNGHQENVFDLTGSDLRNRIVDVIDIVKDQLTGGDYVKEEDPKLFVSDKTGRGPLCESWLEDYWNEVKGKTQPTSKNMSLMCAYKLCRVEFRYWGMQTKLEKFIHDTALRKTMVRAHRQAWAWQDEWHGLTMDDIREIERQTQLALQKKMGNDDSGEDDEGEFLFRILFLGANFSFVSGGTKIYLVENITFAIFSRKQPIVVIFYNFSAKGQFLTLSLLKIYNVLTHSDGKFNKKNHFKHSPLWLKTIDF